MPDSLPKQSGATDSQAYQQAKERARRRSARLTLAGQDIGAIPPPLDGFRRARAEDDFRFFCETYFPHVFNLAWSADHLRVIAKIERVVRYGESLAVAMPRGSGKTSLCLAAVLWAVLTGRHKFVVLIAGSEDLATRLLANLKAHLETNDLLLGDFPETMFPIRRLEGEARKAGGQRYYGTLTRIGWDTDELVMPTIPGSLSSGAIIRSAGLSAQIRGAVYVRDDGQHVRPTLAVCDDPQTDGSAKSVLQTDDRELLINGAVAGLAGPDKRTAIIIPCTVICQNDLADRLLDHQKNPEYQGERTKLLNSFPTNEKLWADYREVRNAGILDGDGGRAGNDFYLKHRQDMDAGADASWSARFNSSEVSAVQHAMNLLFKNEATFWSEYQNDPQARDDSMAGLLTADDVAGRLNGLTRGVVPTECQWLTMFVDVQKEVLYYVVAAWERNFTGYIVDYGTYPDQGRSDFTVRDIPRPLQSASKASTLEGQLHEGLEAVTAANLGREWPREDGAVLRVGVCLIDANWAQSTDTVYQFCRRSVHAAVLMPSHGQYVGGANKPWTERDKKKGERVGLHWRVPATRGARMTRHVLVDTNFWKSFVHMRLAAPVGDQGSLSLWGRVASKHRLFAEHMTSEYRVRVEARGRVLDEWKARVGKPDNHWLDCMVGSAVGASMLGAVVLERLLRPKPAPGRKEQEPEKKREKVRYL